MKCRESSSAILGIAVGTLLTAVLLLVLHDSPSAQIPAFVFLWIWPAASWFLYSDEPAIERFLIAAGLSFLLVTLITLFAAYLPGSVQPWIIMAGVAVIVSLPLIATCRRGSVAPVNLTASRGHWLALFLIIFLAIILRITNLGYKEFQGDEGVIMVRAASILTGDESEIFLHQKGPVEILLPAATWSITGTIDDYWSRLPFTWAGLLQVVAVYWLARRWFGGKAGLVAGLLFAIGGFGIAFSRIVQYQNLVMLWGTLALITATRYRDDGRQRHLLLTSAFSAAGLLAHYDAILVLPAIFWVLGERLIKTGQNRLKPLLLSLLVGVFVIGVFYLPFALSPNAARTLDYLLADRVTVSEESLLFGWSGPALWQMMTFYNSIWYVLGLILLSLAGMIRSLRKRKEIAATIYLLVPFLFYLIIVGDPRTHVYTLFPGAVVLAGYGASALWNSIVSKESPILRWAAIIASALWLTLVVVYPILMFVDISSERQRTWITNRPSALLYPVTWDEPPLYGLFGFPHQAGWRAAGDLVDDSAYPYASNEEEEITNWYMAQKPRTHCDNAGAILIAENAQDEVFLNPQSLEGFTKSEIVHVEGEPTLVIYKRDPVEQVGMSDASQFDRWLKPEEAAPPRYGGEKRVDLTLDDQVRLLGYDIDLSNSTPGGDITVTLYWEALTPIDRNKQVFVHLYDGTLWAQHDGAPECAINPTTRWEPGQIIPDPHIIEIPDEISVDSVPLIVGMYDLISKDRMRLIGSDQDYIHLEDVDINRTSP